MLANKTLLIFIHFSNYWRAVLIMNRLECRRMSSTKRNST